ncbi:hypothetical protein MLD38_014628 [Melastoma candidum]|uniref:Uncharacterized protein n=1 Tax=Melastoma candidum TaxID=119954 RepID=A0ACB9RH47_9MYRT|nr:hypothetical protein MLD38_014628 [Melastoma candidum]
MVKQKGGIYSDETLLPYEALAGLFWACLGRVKGTKQDLVGMTLGHDVRKILGLDKGFFGNCVVYNNAQLEITDGGEIGVGKAARAIKDAMSQFDRLNVLELIDWVSYYIEPACKMGQIVILPSHEGVMSRVMMTASEDDLGWLCRDDLVQQLGPTILMGGKSVKL